MCLSIVTKRYISPFITKKWSIGYKIFNVNETNKISCTYFSSPNFIFNRIYKSTDLTIENFGVIYKSGFHIFISLNDAVKYLSSPGGIGICKVFKVLYNNIIAKGVQNLYMPFKTIKNESYGHCLSLHELKVVVARKLKIIEEINESKKCLKF